MDSIKKISIVIPCYNEEKTLENCVDRVQKISDENLLLELIIVDDSSSDRSLIIAKNLAKTYNNISVLSHDVNKGKGAALRTGFKSATGDYVAVQDADLEYDPQDLKKLLVPLLNNDADVVFGSRFQSSGAHRVLYFWHSMGNKFLTFLSNMFTDLNLTDMETCYKVFRRDVIKKIEIEENRLGFEPEIVAKVAQLRLRIYEMGISYHGRTYEDGKKIGVKDGLRALYCIIRYNAHKAPILIQLFIYLLLGSIAAIFNLISFLVLYNNGFDITIAAPLSFFLAAVINYFLGIKFLFTHKVKWNLVNEVILFSFVVLFGAFIDLNSTSLFIDLGLPISLSKIYASLIVFIFNFLGRKFLVFPEKPSGSWK